MIRTQYLIFLILIPMIIPVSSQNTVPERSDILFEISGDSLLRNNNPQDLNLSITCSSAEEIENYILRLDNVAVLWTIVSAEMNDQPLWLIMNENRSERSDILSWNYDQEEQLLRFYPPPVRTTYTLKIMLRVNLLKANSIQKKTGKEVSLEAQTANGIARCSTNNNGNMITFR